MAESARKKRKLRPAPETVRQRAESKANAPVKPRRIRRTAKTALRPLKAAHRVGAKEIYLPMPDNRLGRFLNKRRYFIPKYFRESWQELRLVSWPNRRETTKLTLAVFTFAIIFGFLVSITDYGLDQIFKRVLLK